MVLVDLKRLRGINLEINIDQNIVTRLIEPKICFVAWLCTKLSVEAAQTLNAFFFLCKNEMYLNECIEILAVIPASPYLAERKVYSPKPLFMISDRLCVQKRRYKSIIEARWMKSGIFLCAPVP